MKTKEAIQKISEEVSDKLPNNDADVMRVMEYILEINEIGIFQSLEKDLTEKQLDQLKSVISRLKKDEPLEFITKIADFYGYKFYVNKHTLIPRQETELLVGISSEKIRTKLITEKSINVADIGTGSGCIISALALSIRDENINYYATEVSPEAAKVAKKNLKAYQLEDSVKFYQGNLLDPLDKKLKLDIIVANLPYIPEKDLEILPLSVKAYEPHIALDGGYNGATIIRELLVQATERMNPKGVILLELEASVADKVKTFTKRFYPKSKFEVINDQYNKERFFVISLP